MKHQRVNHISLSMPREWTALPLDNLKLENSSISYGVVQPGPEDHNGIQFIRGGDIKNGKVGTKLRTITKEVSDQYKRTVLRGGELIVSLVGYPGECAIVPEHLAGANIARQVGIIRLKKGVIGKYVQYYLSSSIGKANLLGNLVGSAQQVINLDMLRKVVIPVPTLHEQQKIAEILSAVDEKIELIDEQIARTQELKKGLMQQLLRKGIGHTEFKESSIGTIPKMWLVTKLGELVTIFSGASPTNMSFEADGDYNYYKVSQLNDVSKYMLRSPFRFNNGPLAAKGSIIFPKRGASIYTNKVRVLKEDSFFDTNIMALKCGGSLDHEFLYYTLVYFGLSKIADTSSIPQINNKHIDPLTIALPPLNEQKQIASILSAFDEKIEVLKTKRALEDARKQGLMQRLLTGKLRVNKQYTVNESTKPRHVQPAL